MSRLYPRRIAALLLLTSLATSVSAVDGVVLLDQNRAWAGSATPGDTPGFPITLSQPGSYRLSGNLTVPAGQTAFRSGRGTFPWTSTGSASQRLFSKPISPRQSHQMTRPPDGIVIRNGTITGFKLPFVLFSSVTNLGQRCRFCVFEELVLR